MRKLMTKDLFNAAKLIKKANLKEPIGDFLKKGQQKDVDANELGIEVLLTVLESCGNESVEQQFYSFLAGPIESTPQEVENMEAEALIDKLKILAQENNLISFFKLAAK